METKEQLQKRLIRKWRYRQVYLLLVAVIAGVLGFLVPSVVIASIGMASCGVAFVNEYIIVYIIPGYSADELRKELE